MKQIIILAIIVALFGLGGCATYTQWLETQGKKPTAEASLSAEEAADETATPVPEKEALFESGDEGSPDEPEEMAIVDEPAAVDKEKSGKRLDKKRIVVKYDNPDCRYEDEGDTAKGYIRIVAGEIESGFLAYGATVIADADEVATIPEALRGKRAYDLIAAVCLSQSERGRTLAGAVPETQYVAIARIRLISAADNLVLAVGEGRFSFNAVSGDPTTAYISAARTAVEKIR